MQNAAAAKNVSQDRSAWGRGSHRGLAALVALFALLSVNGVYLLAIRVLEQTTGGLYQNSFYQYMFLGHLAVGVLATPLAIGAVAWHGVRMRRFPDRRVVHRGVATAAAGATLIITGFLLMRVEGFDPLRDEFSRSIVYLLHIASPVGAVLFYVAHRRARQAGWGLSWRPVLASVALVGLAALLHVQEPRPSRRPSPEEGEQYFSPSLARTASGGFLSEEALVNDQYCIDCHADTHERWRHSAHHLSSFNNPAYLASVRETRQDLIERDGSPRAARFCAGCHDPAPFFSGVFDDQRFDDPEYDIASDPLANAGITCTACHAITHINSPRGNADYTIDEPVHYPFANSKHPWLKWINHTLVRANPAMHKQAFLKPLHKSTEFCGTCHKVHLPQELNDYRFLRGQNHYDSFLLSGVSGHGAASFYYPPRAEANCNNCHMPLLASDDLGAAIRDDTGRLTTHDHLFPSANTAVGHLLDSPDWVEQAHRDFNNDVMRVDLFGLKAGGTVAGELIAPLGPARPALKPGQSYLIEAVIRTLKMGHHFTQGTADSNQVWLDISLHQDGKLIGRSGGKNRAGEVDPWSHFVNAFMLDVDGRRIDRRNAEDIFVPLYNNQIPPGAGQVTHYRFTAPEDSTAPITIRAALRYRKFDTQYLRYFTGDQQRDNDLPIMTLAEDEYTFQVVGGPEPDPEPADAHPEWMRWNDYGIGLLLEGQAGSSKGELRQAEAAFSRVEELGRADGPLNLARVYLKEGRLAEASAALARSAGFDPPPNAWTQLWLTGQTNLQNGALDEAIENFQSILTMDTPETAKRRFDFSRDYRVTNALGRALFERSKFERGDARREPRHALLRQAAESYEASLQEDPENVAAHYNLSVLFNLLGEQTKADKHRDAHLRYKLDDNARDQALLAARRRYPAADHAAESIVIRDLQRPNAYGMRKEKTSTTTAAIEE